MKRNVRIATLMLVTTLTFSFRCEGQSAGAAANPPLSQDKSNSPQTPPTIDPSLIRFFSGTWGCAGEFANGKKIEADVVFSPELDNRWLQYRHTDRPPNRFKAMGMWGVEKTTGKMISIMEDSSGGGRLFLSNGWISNSISFQSATLLSPLQRQERFTYAAESDAKFKMTYEFSLDGTSWKLGDYLICTRTH